MLIQIYAINFFLNFFLFQKARRRSAALEELSSKGWENEETRGQIKKILKVDFMSNDEECDDGLITHPPSWQSDTFG